MDCREARKQGEQLKDYCKISDLNEHRSWEMTEGGGKEREESKMASRSDGHITAKLILD